MRWITRGRWFRNSLLAVVCLSIAVYLDHPEISRTMIRALQEAGGRPLDHEYPGIGHNCWDRTYAMPDLYQWMLGQRHDEPPRGDQESTPGRITWPSSSRRNRQ